MKRNGVFILFIGLSVIAIVLTFGQNIVFAHCDGLDGPVIMAAKKALDTGDVNLVLFWVQSKDDTEIKKAFQKALAVRKLGSEAKDLADMYFFETLVRIHRAGEGAPYTGLKPAGRDLGPAVPAADKAIETGSIKPLMKLLEETMHNGVHRHFEAAVTKKGFKKNDIEAGREFVKAYVEYVHCVERIYETTKIPAHGHYPEPEKEGGHKH